MSRSIGFIPARSGSKGVKNKNIKKLNKKPLLNWSIESAIKSILDEIVLSSDSSKYLNLAGNSPKLIKDLRPKHLAKDKTETVDVIIEYGIRNNLKDDDIIVLLQPTCPFRHFKLINKSIRVLTKDSKYKSVVSVIDVGATHPNRMKIIKNNFLQNYFNQGFEDMRPRQILPKVYIRSGSVYASKFGNIKKNRSLVSKSEVYPLIENTNDYINIDTNLDFELARIIAKKRLKLNG